MADHDQTFEADETLARRLDEARAFGRACDGLAAADPELSAKAGLNDGQRYGGWSLAGAFCTFVVLQPDALWLAFTSALTAVFGLIIVLRICASLAALVSFKRAPAKRTEDDQLPVLTLLVPLYREAEVTPQLIDAIARLDYPASKLDVKLLLEADDETTIRAVRGADPPPWFEILPVPPGAPRTKPKALNYGLAHARGEYVAVFDAEDLPSPEQPREAITAFRKGRRNLAVVQAPLLIDNGRESWLTGQFAVEYGIHFLVWLPLIARLGAPTPLGGTSNYFRRDKLVEAGGWDAWNVTEDADLGIRLARFGGHAGVISAPTWEEAPARLKDWFPQRTRWMKGHLQTWLVANRRPFSTMRQMGILNFIAMQVVLGGSVLASLMHAPLIAWILLASLLFTGSLEGWHLILFGVGYGSVVVAAYAGMNRRFPPLRELITLPFYWVLQSIAMAKALREIRRRPHHWAKTPHRAIRPPPQTPPQAAPAERGDNVIQLEFRFEANDGPR